jgi:PKD repeat protein
LSGLAPLTVNFTDQSAGLPTAWEWDFTNDGITDSTLQNPTYTYSNPGTYSVKLSVSNAYGSDSKLRTNYIQVNAPPPPPPVVDFVASPLVGFNPLGVGFTDQSINAPTSWEWDFTNDGIVDSTAQNPMHIYPTPGTYTVKLTVSNDYGSDSKTRVNYIEVNVAPPDIIVTTWPYPIYSFDSLDTEFGINTTAGGLLV